MLLLPFTGDSVYILPYLNSLVNDFRNIFQSFFNFFSKWFWMHNLALFPINPEPQRLSPATGFKEICDARLSKLTAISSTEFSMFICKQHLRIIALSFYSVKQKTGVFYKKIKFFVYFDISFYLSKSTGQTLPWNTIYRNVRAYARARARVCMRVNIIRIFRFLFFRQTVFWDFLKKAFLKQDCNNAKFFRLFLSCKRFIILSIILQADY